MSVKNTIICLLDCKGSGLVSCVRCLKFAVTELYPLFLSTEFSDLSVI